MIGHQPRVGIIAIADTGPAKAARRAAEPNAKGKRKRRKEELCKHVKDSSTKSRAKERHENPRWVN